VFPRTFVAVLLLTTCTIAADPSSAKPLTPNDLDRLAVDSLRAVHDRGADLYNAADAPSTYRLYEGALLTVSPFLAHRPAVQKVIADGLAEAGKMDTVKARAFRLHEIIELVRGELRKEIKKAEAEPKKPDADPPQRVLPPTKPADPPKPTTGTLGGVVTLDGKPVAGASVTIVSLDLPASRVYTAVTDAAGKYTFPDPLPVSKYAVMLTPDGAGTVPAKYRSTQTSGVTVAVTGGPAAGDLALESK
jgi:hypothetical protein